MEAPTRVPAGIAKVAELVDALDLGSCGVTRESSSLSFRTNNDCQKRNQPDTGKLDTLPCRDTDIAP